MHVFCAAEFVYVSHETRVNL